MESYITRQQVREINKKLFANDIICSDYSDEILEKIIAHIIQKYDPTDSISGVPSIIGLYEESINSNTLSKLELLDIESVIIKINNRVLADSEKVLVIRQLKEKGYKIAIEINRDDTVFTLAKILADIIIFNIQDIPKELVKNAKEFACKKLAYNVNTPEDYVMAEASNIDYYEGTYISPSKQIEVHSEKHSKVNFVQIIALINSGDIDVHKIAEVISHDSLMSAQVIRLSNTMQYGTRYKIESIDDAVVRIGLNNLKKWIFLLQFSNRDDKDLEGLLQTSYLRALLCESIAKEYKSKELKPNNAFLIGLFSTLDALTGEPINKLISDMKLSETIEDALIYREGIGGTLINLVRAYENANWTKVDKYSETFRLSKNKLFNMYFNAVEDVTKIWKELTEINKNNLDKVETYDKCTKTSKEENIHKNIKGIWRIKK